MRNETLVLWIIHVPLNNREAVLAKFTQHPEQQELLLSTGGTKLIEHADHDDFWDDGGDGGGKNMLGRILTDVRQILSTDT